jgi:hypothetical protein
VIVMRPALDPIVIVGSGAMSLSIGWRLAAAGRPAGRGNQPAEGAFAD